MRDPAAMPSALMCDQGSAGNAADMRADADEDAAAAAAPAAVAHDGDAPGGPVAAAAAAAAPPARRAREDGAAMASPPPKKQRAIVAAGKKAAQSHKGSPDPLVAVLKDAIVGFTAAVTPKAAVAHVTDVLRKVVALVIKVAAVREETLALLSGNGVATLRNYLDIDSQGLLVRVALAAAAARMRANAKRR